MGALVECQLETGRTHQIRVHLSSKGFPIAGDALYGGARVPPSIPKGAIRDLFSHLGRQMLHAASLSFDHPRSKKRLTFSAPLPLDMAGALDAFRMLAA